MGIPQTHRFVYLPKLLLGIRLGWMSRYLAVASYPHDGVDVLSSYRTKFSIERTVQNTPPSFIWQPAVCAAGVWGESPRRSSELWVYLSLPTSRGLG